MFHWTYHFKRQFNKLPHKIQKKGFDRLNMLAVDEFDSALHNHKLHGEYAQYRSINITGDVRLLYKRIGGGIYLAFIGTHSELYQ